MSIIWKNEFKGKGNQRRGQISYKNMNINLKNLMLPGWRLGSNWLKRESLILRMDLLSDNRAGARAKFEGKILRKMKKRAKVKIWSEKRWELKISLFETISWCNNFTFLLSVKCYGSEWEGKKYLKWKKIFITYFSLMDKRFILSLFLLLFCCYKYHILVWKMNNQSMKFRILLLCFIAHTHKMCWTYS